MNLIIIAASIGSLYFLVTILRTLRLIQIGKQLARDAKPYEQLGMEGSLQILIIGDSTGYGTGASHGRMSVAGRIGSVLPAATITNRSRNGLTSKDLAESLTTAIEKHYDLIVIHIGANDVLHFKNLSQSREYISRILEHASSHAKQVAFFTSGKIGEAPFFPPYIAPVMTYRALYVRSIAKSLVQNYDNVMYVDLVVDGRDVLSKNPAMYYSSDKLHPSGEGYGVWFERLREETDFYGIVTI